MYQIGDLVYRVLTGERGRITAVYSPESGAIFATQTRYTIRWVAGGPSESDVFEGQIQPVKDLE